MRALLALLLFFPVLGHAAATQDPPAFDDEECATILERWANDPKAVPKSLVAHCKDQLAAAVPEPRVWPAPAAGSPTAGTDPCAGPNAAASVLCWGPWAALAPAAAPGAAATAPAAIAVEGYETRPEIADVFVADLAPQPVAPPLPGDDTGNDTGNDPGVLPPLPPPPPPPPPPVVIVDPPTPPVLPGPVEPLPLPLGSCIPGAPCGFATVVAGVSSDADTADTRFTRIELAPDGSAFTIDPGAPGEINSVDGMATRDLDRPDEFANLEARGRSGDLQSALNARVLRNGDGDIDVAADIWTHGNRVTREAQSGYFAWGNSTTQAALDALNTANTIASFSGRMLRDIGTTATMTLSFGTQPAWSGSWVNPGYSFSAGGPVTGVDLVSDPARFSSNVQSPSVVQGIVLGPAGDQSIAHIIDVELSSAGRIRDIGLLRQTTGP